MMRLQVPPRPGSRALQKLLTIFQSLSPSEMEVLFVLGHLHAKRDCCSMKNPMAAIIKIKSQ